jgi:UDP-glucose 4-epimerase
VVLAAQHLKRIEGAVLRLSNSFGAPTHAKVKCWDLLIPDLCRQAVTKHEIVLRSSGLQRRDFIPMRDACRAIEHVLRLPSGRLGDGLFNVGGEWSPTVLEVACLIQQRCTVLLRHTPQLARKQPQPDELTLPLTYHIDRLRQTGFGLQTMVNDEIDDLLRFCKDHFA